MGLTVNYRYEARGGKADLKERLAWLKGRFEELPVQSVGEVVEVKHALVEMGYGRYRDERLDQGALGFMMTWAYFDRSAAEKAVGEIIGRIGGTAFPDTLPPRERQRYRRLEHEAKAICRRRTERIARSGNGLTLKVDVGEGCERFTVTLGRLGNGRLWRGARFTKTQYAEHFVPTHLAVIRMLDLCKEAGILKSVNDEGHYWETRDLEVLAKNINASTDMVRAVAGMLADPARERGFQVDSPIERSANYMRIGDKKRLSKGLSLPSSSPPPGTRPPQSY